MLKLKPIAENDPRRWKFAAQHIVEILVALYEYEPILGDVALN